MDQDKKMSVDDLIARLQSMPKEEIERIVKKHTEQQMPNEDGSCRQEKCTGAVVQYVSGFSSSGYHYSLPRCNICGHQYILTGDIHIPVVGMKEFQEMMNTPYGI